MSYDHWKTTNPADEFLGSAEQQPPAVPTGSPFWYRGFIVTYDPPPIPVRDMDWRFVHDDYDGAPDSGDTRIGTGPSAADCVRQINEYYESFEDDEQLRHETETRDLSDDRDALASAGFVEGE